MHEEAEFTALVHRQSRFAFRVAYAVLLQVEDAEDAVQEAFLKLYRHGGWLQIENEKAFLARVVWRVAVDRLRSPRASSLNAAVALEVDPPSRDPDPEQSLLRSDRHARVHELIEALPADLRVPLVLSSEDDLNSREIAEVLGIPEGTVRTRLQRARQMLRDKLIQVEARRAARP